MAYSKISICNMALAFLGEDSIRSFDENNTRSSLCDRFYDLVKNYQLSRFDWNFARKLAKLQPIADFETPPGIYPYNTPADCKAIRELYPRGSHSWWEVMGRTFLCKRSSEVYVYYTSQNVTEAYFSDPFAFLLSLSLAIKLSPPLTQDKELTRSLFNQYKIEESNAWEADANMSNDYKPADGIADYDLFVNPDGFIDAITGFDVESNR